MAGAERLLRRASFFVGSLRRAPAALNIVPSVVVGKAQDAFIWDSANGMRNLTTVLTDVGLDLTGWALVSARGISEDGLTIVGYGPTGETEAWLARLDSQQVPDPNVIPEPASIAIWSVLGVAVAGGAWRRRRKLARG